MVKYFAILRKRSEWTDEEFRQYWKGTHGPLVAKLPGLVRYVQHHVHSEVPPNVKRVDEPIQGVAEMWFESESALKQAMKSPDGQRVAEDAAKLFDETTNHFDHLLGVDETIQFI